MGTGGRVDQLTFVLLLLQLVGERADQIKRYKSVLKTCASSITLYAPISVADSLQQGMVTLLMRNESAKPPTFAEVRVNTYRNMLEVFTLVVSEPCCCCCRRMS